jgi:hypothetical protein
MADVLKMHRYTILGGPLPKVPGPNERGECSSTHEYPVMLLWIHTMAIAAHACFLKGSVHLLWREVYSDE